MPIERVVIENFKSFRRLDLPLNPHMNLVVGNNEVGKSTLLEAIHAVVTGQLHGRNIAYEITPYLFHQPTVQEYLAEIQAGRNTPPPHIRIEAHLGNDPGFAALRGTNNSLAADTAGIRLLVELNDDYREEFDSYLQQHQKAGSLPVEFYTVRWYSFANNGVSARSLPVNPSSQAPARYLQMLRSTAGTAFSFANASDPTKRPSSPSRGSSPSSSSVAGPTTAFRVRRCAGTTWLATTSFPTAPRNSPFAVTT